MSLCIQYKTVWLKTLPENLYHSHLNSSPLLHHVRGFRRKNQYRSNLPHGYTNNLSVMQEAVIGEKNVICGVDVDRSKRDIKRRGFCHHLIQGQRAFTGWGEPAKPSPSMRLMFNWRRCFIHSSCSIFLPFNDVWTWADGTVQLPTRKCGKCWKESPQFWKLLWHKYSEYEV